MFGCDGHWVGNWLCGVVMRCIDSKIFPNEMDRELVLSHSGLPIILFNAL